MRRTAAAAIVPLVLALCAGPALAAPTGDRQDIADLTLLATTDTHGTALDYDYFTGKKFGTPEKPQNTRGMDHLSTAISQVREAEGADSVVLLDNGDANQGSSLESVYHAERGAGTTDPIAALYNHLGYDAGTLGNHEFNYGMGDLAQYRDSLDFPLLGANVLDRKTGKPYFKPYTIVEKTTADGHKVKVGVVGVVTPGVRVWDGPKVKDLQFQDMVEAAQTWVPEAKKAGADVVVVSAHTGLDAEGYTWDPADLEENVGKSIAEKVPGVDVVIGGHSHVTDQVQTYYTNPEGREVLYTQPGYHARFLSEVDLPLSLVDGKVTVDWTEQEKPTAQALQAADYPADPQVAKIVAPWHEKTVDWVGTVVATATEEMDSATSAWEDTAILDFINKVQTDEVTRAMKGTKNESLPVVSEASPFSREAVFKKGDVTIADMASLYVYDNTLLGVKLTGAQLKDYLEHSARYYKQQEPGVPVADWSAVTNAQYEGDTRGIPDYSYDVLSGVDYHIDISKPVGERIQFLTLPDGTPLGDDDEVVLALNNYRQSGGSGYPHVKDAEVVYDEQIAIRDLMIDWAQEKKVIDPTTFFFRNWTVDSSPAKAPVAPGEGEQPGEGGKPGEGDKPGEGEQPGEGDEPGKGDEPAVPGTDEGDDQDAQPEPPVSDNGGDSTEPGTGSDAGKGGDSDADGSGSTGSAGSIGSTGGSTSGLARTGADVAGPAALASALLLGGFALMRRRHLSTSRR